MRSIVWLGSAMAALLIAFAAIVGLRGTTPPSRKAAPAAAVAPAQPAPVAASVAPSAPAAVQPPAAPATPPSFDIVRIEPGGQAVIAGRAMPGDRVRVLDGDKPIGEVTADARGEWVLVPDKPIAAGNRQLGLEASGRDGGPARRSGDVVALSVTPSGSAPGKGSALAVLLPGDADKPARVLQQPASAAGPALSFESAEYARGRLLLAGRATPGAQLNVYAGDRLLGRVTADNAGKWSLTARYDGPESDVDMRLDELAADGSVAYRVATPLEAAAAAALAASGSYVVQRGNSLWLIARHLYGHGTRYTAIFGANRAQIQDPNRIYPGQEFKLPKM